MGPWGPGEGGPGEGVLERGVVGRTLAKHGKLAQNIKTRILLNLAKNGWFWPNLAKVGMAKVGIGQSWFGQTWL